MVAPTPVVSPNPTAVQRWGNTIVTALLLLIVLAVTTIVVARDRTVRLEVDGRPLANGEAVLAGADAAFRDLVAADGATAPAGAGCWFARPRTDPSGPVRPAGDLRVACGPVRWGVGTADEVWATGAVSWIPSASGSGEVTERFSSLNRVEAIDRTSLARPDGEGPPAGDLPPVGDGLRDREGRRIDGADDVLAEVEPAVLDEAAGERASIADDAACWFGLTPDPDGRRLSDGTIWCGPILLPRSDADEPWVRLSFVSTVGDRFVEAEARAPSSVSATSTRALPEGTQLFRPDGRAAPANPQLDLPDREPQAAGFTDVLDADDERLADVDAAPPTGPGTVTVPGRTFVLEGTATVPKLGSGREAIVAADGEELVVARFRRTDTTGTRGSAQIEGGGRRRSLTDWSGLPERGAIVASVPAGTDAVLVVTTTGTDGAVQRLSLTTGGPG